MKKDNDSTIEAIDSYAIHLLKQIHQTLTDMGKQGRQDMYNTPPGHRTIYEESVYVTLDLFLKQQQRLESKQMLELLAEAYRVLETDKSKVWEEDEEDIYYMLEKIVQLGTKRKNLTTVFDQITLVTAAMSEGDFTKRIEHTKIHRLGDRNLLNYFANVFNMLNDDLAENTLLKRTAVKKSIAQSIIHVTGKAMIVLATDEKGKISFLSDQAKILYNWTEESFSNRSMSSVIVDFSKIKDKILTEGGVNSHRITLKANAKKQVSALLTAQIAYDTSGKIDGVVYYIQPLQPLSEQ